jgi:hypothetical protein
VVIEDDGIAFVHRSDSGLPVNWTLGTVGMALPPWAHQFPITLFFGNAESDGHGLHST